MILIAAVDLSFGIGNEGQLLAHIKKDLQYFKDKTTGQLILLGRKTLETFPGKKPLPNRQNIILSHDKDYFVEGADICHNMEEVFNLAKLSPDKQLYIAGGGSIYKQFLPYCSTALITKFHQSYPADVYLENLDRSPNWLLKEESDLFTEENINFSFCVYERIRR